jgi:hypothetical protein
MRGGDTQAEWKVLIIVIISPSAVSLFPCLRLSRCLLLCLCGQAVCDAKRRGRCHGTSYDAALTQVQRAPGAPGAGACAAAS